MMKLLLSKELQIICRLILVQRLIWCVQAGQFAGKIDQAFSRIAAERLTVGSEFEAGNQLAIKSGLRLSNEWIKRLVRSDFQNRNLIRSNRESIDRPGLTHEINLLNSVLKRTNVTNHLVGTKLSPLSGLSDSSIDLHRLNEPNELVKSAKLFEFNGLDEGQSKRRIDELANNNSDRPANRSNRFAAATQSKRSREASVRGREESSMLDNGSSEEEEDELYEIPSAGIVALAVCYMTISLCAIVGNLIVLFIVIKSKKMQNPTNYLLANLSASDFLIGALAIPFQFEAALLQRWILPLFFCSFCPTIQQISLNCSILTLTTLSLDRYRAILYPLKTKTSRLKSKLIIVIIWLTSIVFALPTYFGYGIQYIRNKATGLRDEPFCNIIGLNRDLWKIYTFSLFVLQYFLPLLIILYCYIRIGLNLLSETNSGIANSSSNRSDLGRMMKNKKRVIKILFLLTSVFAVFWFPFQVYQVLSEIYPSINTYRYINVVFFLCHLLAMANSICQPFILFFYSEKWNLEIYRLYGSFLGPCNRCLPRSATIQRARFNQHDHTNFSSTNNNTNIALNCTTTNNTCHSTTNNLSNTPNSNNNLGSENGLVAGGRLDECIEFSRLNRARLNGRMAGRPETGVRGVDCEVDVTKRSSAYRSPDRQLNTKSLQLAKSEQEQNEAGSSTKSAQMNERRVYRNSVANNAVNNGAPENSSNGATCSPHDGLSNNLDHNLARNVKPNLINRNQITRLFDERIASLPSNSFPVARNLRHYLAVRLSCCLMIDQQLAEQLIKYLAIQTSRTLTPNRLNLDRDSA